MKRRHNLSTLWTTDSDLVTFVKSDMMGVGWKTVDGKMKGAITTSVRLVSDSLSWTKYQTIMTSDSEDDSDYIPTEPQNDGLYSYPF